MISVLLIEKNGTVREQKIKSFDKNDFYKIETPKSQLPQRESQSSGFKVGDI